MGVTFLQHSPNPQENTNYVFDSNVWLPILGFENDETVSEHYKTYFGKIFKLEKSKIILCPLQISELLNRLLRFHAFKKYDKLKGAKPEFAHYYKQAYRGSEDFKNQYASIIDDIDAFESHILLCDIPLGDLSALVDFNTGRLDFNDHYLYLLAKAHNATIITDDGDFRGLDVPVGTFNKKLYNSYKDSIKPLK